jgi:hypothetical protein
VSSAELAKGMCTEENHSWVSEARFGSDGYSYRLKRRDTPHEQYAQYCVHTCDFCGYQREYYSILGHADHVQ